MNETERLRIKLQAAEAEILRLQSGYDDLRSWCNSEYGEYDFGYDLALDSFVEEIDKITKPL